jgi:stage II sporulation protein D
MGSALSARAATAWLVGAACCLPALGAPATTDPLDEGIGRLAARSGQAEPRLRIGLSDAPAVELTSDRPFRVVDPATGEAVWLERFEGALHVVAQGAPAGGVATVFRVQVGAYGSREAAERERSRLAQATGAPAVLHHDPDRGNWRVRVGRAEERLALGELVERLRQSQVQDLWIVEEPAHEVAGVSLRLVHGTSFESHAGGRSRLVALPEAGSLLRVEGRPYRGVIELRVTAFGTVRPINWIELESYLRGVVPAELGPEMWPQLEALKAQAVAARTYAWRNRGQFSDEGYDLCATPRCQVYDGAEAEHPLSDRALASTRGEILSWQGEPIVALYTATCGGHTENGGEIFAEHAEAYLKGVPCRAEEQALATVRALVPGRELSPVLDETGAAVTRDWALLRAAGVLDEDDARHADSPLTAERLRRWTGRLARLCGIPEPRGPLAPVGDLGHAAAMLVADLGWGERGELLLSEPDLPALLRDPGAADLARLPRRALAYLASVDALWPHADGRFHVERRPTSARLIPALAHVGETYRAFGLRETVLSAVEPGYLELVEGQGHLRLRLAATPYVFGRGGGGPVPASRLEVWPGDRLRLRTDSESRVDFLELLPPLKGAADDRSAAVYSWEVRKTRRELEASINERVSIGTLKDLRVVRRGISGRVVELEVVGSAATSVVRGFDIRRLLDLREILTVIEIQRDERGEIRAVVFAGKGWGHGVGLCQVGAYGMALRGASYREILAHYYSGAELVRRED